MLVSDYVMIGRQSTESAGDTRANFHKCTLIISQYDSHAVRTSDADLFKNILINTKL